MLVIEFKINTQQIDQILVQRIRSTKKGINTYKIIEPKGYEVLIKHHYDEGYFPLFKKVIDILSEKGYGPKSTVTWKKLSKMREELEKGALTIDGKLFG